MKRLSLKRIGALCFLLGILPALLYACGLCAQSMIWRSFPPIITWSKIGIAWFAALSIFALATGQKLKYIPHLIIAVILIGVAYFLDMTSWGPVINLPFLGLAFSGGMTVLAARLAGKPLKYDAAVYLISAAALGFIFFTVVSEMLSPTPRAPADVILRWEGTVSERSAFSELQKLEPDSASSYRRIVKEAEFFAVSYAADRLALIGEPERDVPLLLDALKRMRENKRKYVTDDLEDALARMTGLSLPENSPVEDWRRAWEKERTPESNKATGETDQSASELSPSAS